MLTSLFQFCHLRRSQTRVWTVVACVAIGWSTAPDAFAAGQRPARPGRPNSYAASRKLDRDLKVRSAAGSPTATTRVIVELQPGAVLPPELAQYARVNGRLDIINGHVFDVPNSALQLVAAHPLVARLHYDRPAVKFNYRTSLTVGTRAVQQTLGLTGTGVGIAIIDSGIATWHDDLTDRRGNTYRFGNQRVMGFVDFVNGRTLPYDDDGHGTHVAGIIAGNGYDSNGQKAGAAPDANLVSLKVLDANGAGTVSNIIRALDWVLANRIRYNIRVVNLSVGATIRESYWTDPLTLAAKRLVDAGVVVVSAAGNFGKNAAGLPQYGGITAPGNAPWVLTVGASSTSGTPRRGDDTMASFSSRGPTYIDWSAKPDLVAPGVGTVSLAAPSSTYYQTLPSALSAGSVPTAALPYLSLSGTSMAAPVVSGTVALMLQANPNLTPNAIKAILQYTAQVYRGYNALTEGAGFLDAVGAVRLARFYAKGLPSQQAPVQKIWSRKITWGNERLWGGKLDPNANAFRIGTTWGSARTDDGDQIVWGTVGNGDGDQIVWGTASGGDGDQIVWGTAANGDGDQIVWGTAANTGDDGDQIVWGTTATASNVVWGNLCGGADCDGVIWGQAANGGDDGDQIVWGTAANGGDDGDQIVWGTAANGGDDGDQIVWGTAANGGDDGDQIVWGTAANGGDDGDQIVWGTAANGDDGDQIVWGTAANGGGDDGDQIVWGTAAAAAGLAADGSPSGFFLLSNGVLSPISGRAIFNRLTDAQLLKWKGYKLGPTSIVGQH